MREEFKQYLVSLYQEIPQGIYEGFLSIFCLGVISFVVWKGIKTGLRYSAVLLLIEYAFFLICSTVVFRVTHETRRFDFHPFWSYRAIQEGRVELILENIMNVAVFVPVGLLVGLVTLNKLKLFKAGLLVFGIGLFLSVSIEALQFFLKRGFSEFDDIFHNTLGCLIGFMLVAVAKGIWLLQKRSLTN